MPSKTSRPIITNANDAKIIRVRHVKSGVMCDSPYKGGGLLWLRWLLRLSLISCLRQDLGLCLAHSSYWVGEQGSHPPGQIVMRFHEREKTTYPISQTGVYQQSSCSGKLPVQNTPTEKRASSYPGECQSVWDGVDVLSDGIVWMRFREFMRPLRLVGCIPV